jgi:AraC-like DNA-binding protein
MKFCDFDEFAASNGVLECEVLQLASLPIEAQVLRVSLDGLVLVRGTENVPYATRTSGPPDSSALVLQLESSGATSWHGRSVDERTLLSYQPGFEHVGHTTGGMVWASLLFDATVLHDAARTLRGVNAARPDRDVAFLKRQPAALDVLRGALHQAFLIAETAPGALDSAATRRSLEESILTAAVHAIDPQGECKGSDAPTMSHGRVVRRAEDALAEKIDTPLYVSDLCKAAGVSERTLRNAFQSLYGLSPIRFLHLRRLHQVRRALRRELQVSVTEVALSFGFGNLGRFAVEYRQLFGESPSHTLRRGAR